MIERIRAVDADPFLKNFLIELAQEQLERVGAAIEQARLRLDSIRLIVEGPDHGE